LIDERAKRKDNFDERNSVAVTFVDGQIFYLPKPWVEIRPIFREHKVTGARRFLTHGADIDAMIDDVRAAEGDAILLAVATVAEYLLCWHYDLSDGELDTILAYRPGDPTSLAWVTAVGEIATGRSGPKVGSDIDD
jgi:hypothetical protein